MPWDEIQEFVDAQSPETKLYLGTDSEPRAPKIVDGKTVIYVDYAVLLAVHIDGCHGCKLFGQVERGISYEKNPKNPSQRLLQEVYCLLPVYERLNNMFPHLLIKPHLDLNSDDEYASAKIRKQAVGLVMGVCGIKPEVKPLALAASFGADRLARGQL